VILVGLILVAAAAVVGTEMILANRETLTVHMWNATWHVSAFWLAVAGAAVLLVAMFGIAIAQGGATRRMRLRRERRQLAAENKVLAERAARAETAQPVAPASDWVAPADRPVPVMAGRAAPPAADAPTTAEALPADHTYGYAGRRRTGPPPAWPPSERSATGPDSARHSETYPADIPSDR
jgi:hypothetical protein